MDSEMSNLTGGLVLRGVVAILFGIAAVFWPGITLVTLLYLFSTQSQRFNSQATSGQQT